MGGRYFFLETKFHYEIPDTIFYYLKCLEGSTKHLKTAKKAFPQFYKTDIFLLSIYQHIIVTQENMSPMTKKDCFKTPKSIFCFFEILHYFKFDT